MVSAPEQLTDRDRPLFIDGAWHVGQGDETIEVVDPCRKKRFATLGTASAAQIATAAKAADRAFHGWRHSSGEERGALLTGIADGLASRRADLTALQMLNNGKPRIEAEMDLSDAEACFRYYAELAREQDDVSGPVSMSDPEWSGLRRNVPIGPVGMIVPWNFPLVTSAWKLAPALAAGCTAVLKVSEMTPLAELVYGDIAADIGLPPGVLNIVTGLAGAGQAMTSDPHFRKLSFTGSNAVGAMVMAAAAERTVPVSLELGGKSPIIVTADADLEKAVELVVGGIFFNCGQMCSATSRLIVEDAIAGHLLDALVSAAEALEIGDPESAEMGPITTGAQYDQIAGHLERARSQNVRCLTGGELLADRPGYFVQPTIFDDVDRSSFLWRDELFGPILSVRRFKDDGEAIKLANDTAFGLVGTVVSGDRDRAIGLGERIDAGHVWVNAPQIILPDSLWGGFRASGIGRELGRAGLSSYCEKKHLTLPADVSA
ncbi:aldehyde dehydrogenase [Pelagivirga sediminicola]|uniref:Aldehyde dehydrogenase n=1 Tax=Pelagivirga sediminicola TaxID=2170575 RepID=A0A2T7G547_9RHOB|nr:aldehyde dehydrogenase family protein [Pelagivirga sediminicola]PVA09553.1 aldehyde dehydrogenase [Pelagivirga sediminicola]